MVIKPSVYIDGMAGSAGGGTVRKSKNRLTLAKKAFPTNPATPAQQGVRGTFTGLAKSWQNLTPAQRQSWNDFAETQTGRSSLGEKAQMSGYDAFMRCNLNIIKAGGSTITDPVTHADFPTCTQFLMEAEEDETSGEVDSLVINATWDKTLGTGTCKAMIYATPILSAGMNIPKNKFKFIAAKTYTITAAGTPVETEIYSDYVAVMGSLVGFAGKANMQIAVKMKLIWTDSGLPSAEYQDNILGSETV